MLDQILSYTSLTSFHPAVVHFPIALLFTAAALDLLSLFIRRYMWMDRAATSLHLLGTLGAGLAYLSGLRAAGALASIPAAAVDEMLDHRELAVYTIAAAAGTTVIRLLVTRLSRFDNQIHLGFFRLVALVLALGTVGLLALTADHGGGLVYQHGLGVESPLEQGGD